MQFRASFASAGLQLPRAFGCCWLQMNEEQKHRAAPRDGHGGNSFGMGAGDQRGHVVLEGTGR